ncbi:MAG: hypothetical protein AAGG08_06455, partial [Actinomycetota bacterium]
MVSEPVSDATLGRWRADWREIPRDQWPVARAHGWRGPLVGWARQIGPPPRPTPRQQADLNVIEREFEQLGLDLGDGAWILDRDPDGPTKVAFRIDSAGRIIRDPAPWDRPAALGIITLTEHGRGRDRRYTSAIQVWNIFNRRLSDHGWSVVDHEGPPSDDPDDPQRIAWYEDEGLAENPYQAVRRAVSDLTRDETPGRFDVGPQPELDIHPDAAAQPPTSPSAAVSSPTSTTGDEALARGTKPAEDPGTTSPDRATADSLGPPPSPCDFFGLSESELAGSTVYRHGWKLVLFTARGHITTRWIPDQFELDDGPRCFDETALVEWLDGRPGDRLDEAMLPTRVRDGWYLTTVGDQACRDRSPDPAVRAGRRTKRTVAAVGGALTIMAAIGFCGVPDDDSGEQAVSGDAADVDDVDANAEEGGGDADLESPGVSVEPPTEDGPDGQSADTGPAGTTDDGDIDTDPSIATPDPAWETLGVVLPGPVTPDPAGGQTGSTSEEWRVTPIVDIVEHASWVVDVEGDSFDALL